MGTSDRREYLTANAIEQDFLDRCQDNLENKLELVCEIAAPGGALLRYSDRNKYLGNNFCEAMLNFPIIKRTLGDWLSPTLEFSRLELTLSNVDGRFNKYLAGGANFDGWIGRIVDVRIGLRDVNLSYEYIYKGRVTEIGGVSRSRDSITFISRDNLDKLNQKFPIYVFTEANYPNIEASFVGTIIPLIYGDWTVSVGENQAIVPAFPINGKDPAVLAGTSALELIISINDNTFFDTTQVYVKKQDKYYPIAAADITNISGNRYFSIKQDGCGGVTTIDENPPDPPTPYKYTSGDQFYVKVKGKALAGYDDNILWQARDILMTYGNAVWGNFDDNWTAYRDKASPPESAIATIKSRVWLGEQQDVMQYVLSMLEQVRLEVFEDRALRLKLNSMQMDDFPALNTIDFNIKNWDVVAGTFTPTLDDKNTWNRARAEYSFDPSKNENAYRTAIFRNQAAITQCGKEISKLVVFPNLYDENTVILQLQEMLKLASAYSEFIDVSLTPRAFLQDLGKFVKVNVKIGSVVFQDVPAMIREIGYDPSGLKIPVKLWSFQMIPYPTYSPAYPGIVGGNTATITEET
jgi:hypothetical protein